MNLEMFEFISRNNKSFPKDKRSKKIMLKVHPESIIVKYIYENLCFKEEGIDLNNSSLIYYKNQE